MRGPTLAPPEQFAPATQCYAPQPQFAYSPSQREIDFAQLVASGADMVDALVHAAVVPFEEAQAADRPSLYRMATRLINTPAVQERIDYYTLLHRQSMSITVERLQQELAAVSFGDFADLFHKDGRPITNPHDIPRHARAAVKEFYQDKDGIVRFKTHDKLKGMQMLGDLSGHFNDAHAAKAPQVTIALGGSETLAIDVTPTPPPTTTTGPEHTVSPPTTSGPPSAVVTTSPSSPTLPECLG